MDFQLNDHNPGVSAAGLFWTMPISPAAVAIDLVKGAVSLCLSDAQMPDLTNLLVALWGGGAVDGMGLPLKPVFSSTASLTARWFNFGPQQITRDPVKRFVYENAQCGASIEWTSIRRGASFATDSNPQTVVFAAVGKELNGVFFD